jgi:hypothetical protein
MTANLNHYEKILSRSHSNYLAQISIEMTEANNQCAPGLPRGPRAVMLMLSGAGSTMCAGLEPA